MNKIVPIKGYCPTQGKEYTINVTYLDASTTSKQIYIKGIFKCDYNKFSDKCNSRKCPLYVSA